MDACTRILVASPEKTASPEPACPGSETLNIEAEQSA